MKPLKQELEYKRMLTKEAYEKLYRWCQSVGCHVGGIGCVASCDWGNCGPKETLQINYYYDTPDGVCNGSGITVRVRQQEAQLKGTVKYHGVGDKPWESLEETFRVNQLPACMEFGGRWLTLLGQTVTKRTCLMVANGVELILDQNFYLGQVDYELELEFLTKAKPAADDFLQWITEEYSIFPPKGNKYARFFEARQALERR